MNVSIQPLVSRPSPLVRVALIGLVTLALLVPLTLVRGLLGERRERGAVAASEIADAWGGRQTVAPPVLLLTYLCETHSAQGRIELERRSNAILPERLELAGTLDPERRARGIFSTVVYRAQLRIQGEFLMPAEAASELDCAAPLLESATLGLGLGDNRGIDRLGPLDWPGASPEWTSGGALAGPWHRGVSARIAAASLVAGARLPFAFELDLRGSETLEVLPVGRESRVELRSPFASPSFRGAFLPTQRAIDASGFSAVWRISPFARSFPQSWCGETPPPEIAASALGVALLLPVDGYLQTERALKYAILVVGLTFLACFLLELAARSMRGAALHPMHYLLVGAALAIFYLLLLALSEHLSFGTAYATAAAAVTLLLAGYATAILASAARGAALAAVLGGCYGGLFVLLGREEYALLIGSLGTFAALALTMWLTRRTDWRSPFPAAARGAVAG